MLDTTKTSLEKKKRLVRKKKKNNKETFITSHMNNHALG